MKGVRRAFPEIQGGFVQGELTGLDLGKIEDVVDERKQGLPSSSNGFKALPGIRGGEVVFQKVRHADDCIEGSAYLMAHGREKSALGAIGALSEKLFLLEQKIGFAEFFDASALLGDVLECSDETG